MAAMPVRHRTVTATFPTMIAVDMKPKRTPAPPLPDLRRNCLLAVVALSAGTVRLSRPKMRMSGPLPRVVATVSTRSGTHSP